MQELLLAVALISESIHAKSCSELAWKINRRGAAGFDYGCGSTLPCGTASYDEAHDLCTSVGARLCTADELFADFAKGTGCNLDLNVVWASDVHNACGQGFGLSAPGASKAQLAEEVEGMGARIGVDVDREITSLGMTCFKGDISRAVALLGDAVSSATLDSAELEMAK